MNQNSNTPGSNAESAKRLREFNANRSGTSYPQLAADLEAGARALELEEAINGILGRGTQSMGIGITCRSDAVASPNCKYSVQISNFRPHFLADDLREALLAARADKAKQQETKI